MDLEEEEIIPREFESLLKKYFVNKKEQTKEEFAQRIAEAENSGDREKIKQLMRELQSAIISEE